MILFGAYGVFNGFVQQGLWTAFIGWFILNAAQESVAQVAIAKPSWPQRRRRHEQGSAHRPGHITLEEYSTEVLRTGRRCHLVVSDDRLVGMMNVHTLNSVSRDEWAHNSCKPP